MYRDECVGIELRRESFEEAKAALEEIAKSNEHLNFNTDHPELENALTGLGFRKEKLKDRYSAAKSYFFTYVRETEKGLEVLVDKNLGICASAEKEPHLYYLRAGQNVQEWYQNRYIEYDVKKKRTENFLDPIFSFFVGATELMIANYFINGSTFSLYLVIPFLTLSFGTSLLLQHYEKKNLLEDNLVKKWPDALLCIAKTSAYESKLRIKTPVIDAEFIDKSAEEEQQAALEAIAEEPELQIIQRTK